MTQKAKVYETRLDKIVKQDKQIQNLFALNRSRITVQQVSISTGALPSSAGSSGGSGNFLETQGDTMVGPIAFNQVLVTIVDGRIKIGETDRTAAESPLDYSSYVAMTGAGTPDDLNWIDGAAYNGQLLFLQGSTTQVLNVKSAIYPAISNITGTGTVTVTTSANHGLVSGQQINIFQTTNFDVQDVNITVTSPTIFTYSDAGHATPETSGKVQDGNIVSTAGTTVILDGTVTDFSKPGIILIFDQLQLNGGAWSVFSRLDAGGNVPDGTATFQHIEWDGSAWVNQIALSFGTTPADSGFLKFPNNQVATAWRNAADDGNVRVFVDTNDDYILDEADNFQITNTTTGASGIANFVSYRNDASPSNGDELGSLRFDGEDDGGGKQQYARMLAGIQDVAAGSEDGLLQLEVALAGSLVPFVRLNDSNNGNFHMLKDITFGSNFASNALVNFANNTIGIGWRNNANDGDISMTTDTNDFLVLTANQFRVTNTITGASGTANFVSYRNDAAASLGDELGSLRFDGNDDLGASNQYVRILAGIADETAGSEDGQMLIQMAQAGSLVSYMSFNLTNAGTVGVLKDLSIANTINIIPATDLGSSLGDTTHAFAKAYINQIHFDVTTKFIDSSGALDLIFEVPSLGDMIFRENGTVFFHCDGGLNTTEFSRPIDLNANAVIDTGDVTPATTTTFDLGTTSLLYDFVYARTMSFDDDREINLGTFGVTIHGTASGDNVLITAENSVNVQTDSGARLAFFTVSSGAFKATVTGSRSSNAALASLLTALANYGLITDSSS